MPALNQYDYNELYPLRVIKNNKDYKLALKSLEAVFDETGGKLAEYAETLTVLIEHYESENFPMNESKGVDLLEFLMAQNDLKQKDLTGIIGTKSSVSEILSRKRPLNLQHIRALADKFNVKPATFI
ncbi:MAG: transcriptional regulator [Desulfobacterales bacterium]|uniref:Transcriptional regulator n=1 Tax=Candidatus Desulfaltia bathyphila TaxID=2841697 RepID=A0A8J6N7Q5_9BACT|nr:transcriptional regulator [Candidatus Desulfaltia bathyphila]MBL7195273.1 transcriptional regulator [Desulfobacterales bacterium]MBL7208009.1 transcriptional regulator [Desulfobacterales bacterium]